MRSVRIRRAIRWPGTCCRVAILLLSGPALLASGLPVLAQNTSVERPAIDRRFAPYIAEASKRFRIPEHWIRAILAAESAQDVRAVSSAGAMGLMQVMPGTWNELRARYALGDDPFAPRDNILAGTAYLREMLDRYGNVGAMLAAYNAGPSRYDEHLATGRPLPAETRAYVAKLAPILSG
ncbi:MAG: lytic transglycosylase domain-containing protein, partial [Mesorhizobium sp.]